MQQIPFEQILSEDTLLGPRDTSGGLGAGAGGAGAGPGPEVAGKVSVSETGSRGGGGEDPLVPDGQSWGRCEARPLGEALPIFFPDMTPGCFSRWEQHNSKGFCFRNYRPVQELVLPEIAPHDIGWSLGCP